MANLNSYLHFDGDCEAAFNHYKSIFGGEFQSLMRYNDVPPGVPAPGGAEANWIMHVSLPIGKHSVLMGSDRPGKFGAGTRGDLSYISIDTDSKDEATRLFQRLSEGGSIAMPIEDTFWGSYFGMLVDKFGVQWMVSYNYPKE